MIDAMQMIAKAQAETGLTNLGDESLLVGLNLLVDALNSEAKLTETGAARLEGQMTATLANRLRVEDWLAKHPELLDRPIEKPLFVFGLPRTGTTLTINLLSADPTRRCFLRWEAFDSVPPPRAEELHAGPRYQKAQDQMEEALKHMPHIAAIHYEEGDSPTECQFSMTPSFCAQVYESNANVPSYRNWFLHEADYRPAFRYHKRLLQLLQAEAPGRWTLKNPWHPLFLDALTEVYPDAQLVMNHRDPVDVLGSACSLIKAVRVMFSDQVDLHRIGETFMETFEIMIARQDAYRTKHGADSIYDLHYDEQIRDPIGAMKRLYAHFDEPFSAEAEAAMRSFLAENPKGKFGKHDYMLEEFGLSAGMVRERFGDYCEKYGVAIKA